MTPKNAMHAKNDVEQQTTQPLTPLQHKGDRFTNKRFISGCRQKLNHSRGYTAAHLRPSSRLFNAQLRGAAVDEFRHPTSFVHLEQRVKVAHKHGTERNKKCSQTNHSTLPFSLALFPLSLACLFARPENAPRTHPPYLVDDVFGRLHHVFGEALHHVRPPPRVRHMSNAGFLLARRGDGHGQSKILLYYTGNKGSK